MTVHVLVVDPPWAGLVLEDIEALGPEDAARLYAAMLKDTMATVDGTGGDLLVNYPPSAAISEQLRDGRSPETALRELAEEALGEPSSARFEVQVGETFAERTGNTVTHLIDAEDANSVALLDGRAPTLFRTDLDNAAMTLRRRDVVIVPSAGGRVAYLGLTSPIEFEPAIDPPEVETLTDRAVDQGLSVGYLPIHPTVVSDAELATLVAVIRARRRAGRVVPDYTAQAIDDLGLSVLASPGRRTVTVE